MQPEWLRQLMETEIAHSREQLKRILGLSELSDEAFAQLQRDTFLYELPCDPTVH